MGQTMERSCLDWDVLLPSRGEGACYQQYGRPRAMVVISTEEHGEERLSVPLAVGKTLKRRQADDAKPICYRTELLYELKESLRRCASARAEDLISRRDYSAHELERKLADDGYSQAIREELVARYVHLGIVDDGRYASVFIRSRLAQGWGPRKIEQELKRRGIQIDEVPGWPDEFMDEEGPDERAYKLASTRRISEKNGYQKLVRFLCSKGYSVSSASKAARRVLDERGA